MTRRTITRTCSQVEMKIRPLTKRERAWVDDLQAVLERCPKRLELITIGDPSLRVIDGIASKGLALEDHHAEDQGLILAHIKGGPKVHGVSG